MKRREECIPVTCGEAVSESCESFFNDHFAVLLCLLYNM